MRISRNKRELPDINLTPLIDVVFLLLIFFMVSTTFQRESELGIELPSAQSETDPTTKDYVDIAVDRKGRYYVNGKPLLNTQRDTLRNALRQEVGTQTQSPLVISADGNAPHQSVMLVLDVAQELNLVRLRFATQLQPESSEEN